MFATKEGTIREFFCARGQTNPSPQGTIANTLQHVSSGEKVLFVVHLWTEILFRIRKVFDSSTDKKTDLDFDTRRSLRLRPFDQFDSQSAFQMKNDRRLGWEISHRPCRARPNTQGTQHPPSRNETVHKYYSFKKKSIFFLEEEFFSPEEDFDS